MSHLILTAFCFLFVAIYGYVTARRTDEPHLKADRRFARAHRVVR